MNQLVRIATEGASLYDVVFVHGLEGDGRITWTTAPKLEESWLAWLNAESGAFSVWSLGYEIKALSWKGNTMPLQDRATNILALLVSKDIGTRPLAFICHSYGGLLVKQLLRNADDSNESSNKRLVQNTRGIVFISTPHTGSNKANWFEHYASILSPGVAVAELQSQDAQLRNLNLWYRNNAERLGINTAVLYETKPTKRLQIVDQGSADPGIAGVLPVPIDADHIDISKPTSKDADVYLHVRRYLRAWFSPDRQVAVATPRIIVRIDWGADSRPTESLRKRTIAVGSSTFPDGTVAYPEGSVLTSSDGTVCFVMKKPSVALRGAIEFMQGWHALVLKGSPDCRVIIGEGEVHKTKGSTFLDVDIASLGDLATGAVYVSEAVVDGTDPTMATFAVIGKSDLGQRLFRAEFEDPRTVRDSSLIHALFVAHPAAESVRRRLIELFLVEYLMEKGNLTSFGDFGTWLHQHLYPGLSRAFLVDILKSSIYFDQTGDEPHVSYVLRVEARQQIDGERAAFAQSQGECVEVVQKSIREGTGSEEAASLADLRTLVEEYLSAIFLEVRLMANYLRRTDQVFDSSTQTLRKFDHIISRRLRGLSESAAETWRTSFIRGLKHAAEVKNAYVATIFHNVLATYYLNRSQRTGRYQRERLKGRVLYIDTNVLYASRVGSSSYNEISNYLLTQLRELEFDIRIFPFSIREYEHALLRVERAFHNGVPEPWVIERNPWIYQEFRINQAVYITFSACREVHSVAKTEVFSEADYDRIDEELAPMGIKLARDFESLSEEEIQATWQRYISQMGSNSWDLDRWWEFRHAAVSKSVKAIEHDVMSVHNASVKARIAGTDEFGPRVLFLTLDSEHLLRLRRAYPFIIGIRQCQEYFLPYLFLNDMPVKQVVEFPNQLLSAQLGMLLMKYRPTAIDIVESSLRSEKPLQFLQSERMPAIYRDVAKSFNQDRLRAAVQSAITSPELAAVVTESLAGLLEIGRTESLRDEYAARAKDQEIARLRAELAREKEASAKKDQALGKQHRTNRYRRSQKKRKKTHSP